MIKTLKKIREREIYLEKYKKKKERGQRLIKRREKDIYETEILKSER